MTNICIDTMERMLRAEGVNDDGLLEGLAIFIKEEAGDSVFKTMRQHLRITFSPENATSTELKESMEWIDENKDKNRFMVGLHNWNLGNKYSPLPGTKGQRRPQAMFKFKFLMRRLHSFSNCARTSATTLAHGARSTLT